MQTLSPDFYISDVIRPKKDRTGQKKEENIVSAPDLEVRMSSSRNGLSKQFGSRASELRTEYSRESFELCLWVSNCPKSDFDSGNRGRRQAQRRCGVLGVTFTSYI